MTRFYTALRDLPEASASDAGDYQQRFEQAMDDDFNTPVALSVLFDLVREINTLKKTDMNAAAGLGGLLKKLGAILGLIQDDPEAFLRGQGSAEGLNDDEVESLVQQRIEAKKNKDWATADKIRDELKEQGIIVEDNAQGSTWRRI